MVVLEWEHPKGWEYKRCVLGSDSQSFFLKKKKKKTRIELVLAREESTAVFSFRRKIFRDTVAPSFVCGNYCSTMD